jgi:hypothetical protein
MVRVKISCKDAAKIPKKRLFEMMNNLYIIQFKKVEEGLGTGAEGGEDRGDHGNGDDERTEEFKHDPVQRTRGHQRVKEGIRQTQIRIKARN